jgi:hypothetical protein
MAQTQIQNHTGFYVASKTKHSQFNQSNGLATVPNSLASVIVTIILTPKPQVTKNPKI